MAHMYYDTFITVAPDFGCTHAKVPTVRGDTKTVAQMQYEMLAGAPFEHTQEDVLFGVWLARQEHGDLAEDEVQSMRDEYFSTGRACMRASPLTKTHGWGVLFDSQGRAALYAIGSDDYERLVADPNLTVVPAMRSKRA